MLTPDQVKAVVGCFANAAKPERILIPGSYARGKAGKGTDLDLLVIEPGADR